MSQVITKRNRISRRIFLRGLTAAHAPIVVGVPPLISMFNSNGTAYAAETKVPASAAARMPEKRYRSVVQRQWNTGTVLDSDVKEGVDYDITPCLSPIARLRDDVLVLSGLDNTHGGNGHPQSLCALMTCTPLTSNGPAAPSIDQLMAQRIGDTSRFRSLQIGVSQESFGGALQKNMSWAGPNRPLPPEEIPHRLFDRLFGAKDKAWINDKTTILDAVRQDAALLRAGFAERRSATPR